MIRNSLFTLITTTLLSLILAADASAACSTPTANQGARDYHSGSNNFRYCDGTNWLPFPTSTTLTACSTAGEFEYDGTENAYKYCNGSNYIKTGMTACTIGTNDLTYQSKITHGTNLNSAHVLELSSDGTKAYVIGQFSDRLGIYDISNSPSAPTEIGVTSAITQLSDANDIKIVGDYVIAPARGSDNLVIIDISTPSAPFYETSISSSPANQMDNIWSVDVSGDEDYAFTVSWGSGASSDTCYLHSIDISDPTTPSIAATLDVSADAYDMVYCNRIRINGSLAYISASDGGFFTQVDISDPTDPKVVTNIFNTNLNNLQESVISEDGKYLYGVTYTGNKFNVIDISNDYNLVYETNITNTNFADSYGITIAGDYAFVTSESVDAISAIDISTPTSPSVVDTETQSTHLNGAASVRVYGRYAYVATWNDDGLAVIDLGCDPTHKDLTGGACSKEGELETTIGANKVEWCDGSNWQTMIAGPSIVPDSMDWANFTTTSDKEYFTGISSTISVELSVVNGTGSPTVRYSHNGSGWTTFTTGSPATISVNKGDSLAFRALGTANDTATITITNVTDSNTELDTVVATVGTISLSYVTTSQVKPDNGIQTHSSVSIGAAADDRLVIVAVAGERSGTGTWTTASVDIGGIKATRATGASDSNYDMCSIWFAMVPTGTTANIALNSGGNTYDETDIAIYRATNVPNFFPHDTDSSHTTSTSNTSTLTIPENGFSVYVVRGGSGTYDPFSWNTATENVENFADYMVISHASKTTTTQLTNHGETASHSSGATNICGASWGNL